MADYNRIVIKGTKEYQTQTITCLTTIDSVPDGRRILEAICARVHHVTIQNATKGNSCRAMSDNCRPPLTTAIRDRAQAAFKNELNASVTKARAGGLTLEHLGRQLAMGLSPGTYDGKANVAPPTLKSPPAPGATAHQAMFGMGLQVASAMSALNDLMDGSRTVHNLPSGWDYELPRLLRNFLRPGGGGASTVSFNPTRTFHCEKDPAMHKRPPAIGLAHELIHALHNSTGMNLGLVQRNGHKLEELVTTGMAPYNFEELSDNKLRTQWSSNLEVRENYFVTGPATPVNA